MSTTQSITSAEQLARAGDIGRCELVRGELITMSPSGIEHGVVVAAITEILRRFVKRKHLGIVTGAETGFVLEQDPDTVRGPDVGFISKHRLPRQRRKRFFEGAPDLAVEVRSPDDRSREIDEKISLWLSSGCQAVWLVDPDSRSAAIHQASMAVQTVKSHESVSGGQVLPGFNVPLSKFFEDLGELDAD